MNVISKHKKLEKILGQESKCLVSMNYRRKCVFQEEIIEHEGEYYLANKMLTLIEKVEREDIIKELADEMIKREENKQKENKEEISIKKSGWKSLFETKKNIVKSEKSKNEINQLKRILETRRNINEKGFIPVIEINGTVQNFKEVLPLLGEHFEWVMQIASFIEVLTIHYIRLQEEFYKPSKEEEGIEPMDYFIFDEKGGIRGFIGIHTLEILDSWYMPHGFEFIVENNLRVFKNILRIMYNKLVIQAGLSENYQEKIEILKDSPLDMFCKSQSQIYSLKDLKEVIKGIKQQQYRTVKDKKKIGVFMDTANIYTPLKYIGIDFNKLLVCIYGTERLKDIAYKYCTLLFLEYPNEKQNFYEIDRKNKKRKELESYGFEVIEVRCQTDHAEQKDDYALQRALDSHMDNIQEALILTGDGHFLDYFRKYIDQDIHVKIISVDKETTSHTIKKEFGDRLYYLEECWEAVNL